MAKAFRLPLLDDATVAALQQQYDMTSDADLRLRTQMVLLTHQGRSVREIAQIVCRSQDTVLRQLNRFVRGGLTALRRRKAPGAAPTITPEWEAELLRVVELDPHSLGVPAATWTTTLLAEYLARVTGISVSEETVRLRLHANGYVCKRPTWTLKRKAEAQEG
jgi:putative transposase